MSITNNKQTKGGNRRYGEKKLEAHAFKVNNTLYQVLCCAMTEFMMHFNFLVSFKSFLYLYIFIIGITNK